MKEVGRPGGKTRPHTSQADRDVIEDVGLADVDERTGADDQKLPHVDEVIAT